MRGRGSETDARISRLLDAAQAEGTCLVPSERADIALLGRMLKSGEVVRPASGLYARKSYWLSLDRRLRVQHTVSGLAAKHPAWAFWSYSAAMMHGLEVPNHCLRPMRAIAARRTKLSSRLLKTRFAREDDRFITVRGVRVTEFWQTVLDCLLESSLGAGLAIADSALRISGATSDELVGYIESRGRSKRGIRRALMIARHADGKAENGGESRTRAFFISRGYLLPELQVEIPDPVDEGIFQVDFLWRLPGGRCVVGELDGKEKYENAEMLEGKTAADVARNERQRESRLTLAGYQVLRFTFNDVLRPDRSMRLLSIAGIPRDLEVQRGWEEEWARAAPGKRCGHKFAA